MVWKCCGPDVILATFWKMLGGAVFFLFAAVLNFSKMGGTFDMSWSRGRSWEAVLWADGGLAA